MSTNRSATRKIERTQQQIPGLLAMSVLPDCLYYSKMQQRACEIRGTDVSTLVVNMRSLNFDAIVASLHKQNYHDIVTAVEDAACALARAGSDYLVVASNTLSMYAESAGIDLPIMGIAQTSCKRALDAGHTRIGLLSTIETDKSGLYHRAAEETGGKVLSLPTALGNKLDETIFDELIKGEQSDEARAIFAEAVGWYRSQGIGCVILGCTDLTPLAMGARSDSMWLIDSAIEHATAAVDEAFRIIR